jgi:hypothetical protein
MNVETGYEAKQLPEKKYINGIAVAVQARSSSRGQTFMAWRHVKSLIAGTGRLFSHLGMLKVSLQGPEEFSDMGECEKDLWVVGNMSWYQQRDCQSLLMELSDGKLKPKSLFSDKTIRLFSQCSVMNHNVLWGHRQPVLSLHPVHSFVLLSMEQVPRLLNTKPVILNVYGAKELIPPAYM